MRLRWGLVAIAAASACATFSSSAPAPDAGAPDASAPDDGGLVDAPADAGNAIDAATPDGIVVIDKLGDAYALAANANDRVYWTEAVEGRVRYIDVDGGVPREFIVQQPSAPNSLVLTPGWVYWGDNGPSRGLYRAGEDGQDAGVFSMMPAGGPVALAAPTNAVVAITTDYRVVVVSPTGSTQTAGMFMSPWDVGARGATYFWTESSVRTVWQGGAMPNGTPLSSSEDGVESIAVAPTDLFWTLGDGSVVQRKANGARAVIAKEDATVIAVSSDRDDTAYWLAANGELKRFENGSFATIAKGPPPNPDKRQAHPLALTPTSVYWITQHEILRAAR